MTIREYHFDITPVPKPRQTQQDKWMKRPPVMAYRAFETHLRLLAKMQKFTLPECGCAATFYLPMPASWSKRKRAEMDGKPHQDKPDWDNLIKAVQDSLLDNDSKVWEFGPVRKFWSDRGQIILTVEGD